MGSHPFVSNVFIATAAMTGIVSLSMEEELGSVAAAPEATDLPQPAEEVSRTFVLYVQPLERV